MQLGAAAPQGVAGGRTIIVAGTGADVTYPQSSRDIFLEAPDQGAVVSLEPWGQAPRRYAFPKRNRVIAALSQSLIICEAGLRSGTFSTAVAADDLGRDLYVVPGSIFSPESMGANRLIADGACVIASEMDLEQRIALDYGVLRMVREGARRSEGRLLAALVSEPTRPDDLARYLQQGIVQVLGALADYESRGVVRRLPDGRFSLTETAYLAHGTMGASHDAEPANAGGEGGR
ncbi:DNA-processing protein DprA [Olsenella massiliensis]|uniref:DNA-processing protein DprA n=1 Tax=Olsenella massiliensis TaxID=1622075 RepID=UPI002E2540CB